MKRLWVVWMGISFDAIDNRRCGEKRDGLTLVPRFVTAHFRKRSVRVSTTGRVAVLVAQLRDHPSIAHSVCGHEAKIARSDWQHRSLSFPFAMPVLQYTRTLILPPLFLAATAAAIQSCCSMTSEELGKIQGDGESCPTSKNYYSVKSLDKCGLCPVGTCRVNDDCFCAGNFLDSYENRESGGPWTGCEYSFGKSWPDSIGKEDVTWRSCMDGVKVPDFGFKACCDLSDDELSAAEGTSNLCPLSKNYYSAKSISKCEVCPPGKLRSPMP